MVITWLVGGFILGTLFATFLDEIMDWARDVFNCLSMSIRKAWVYIKRIPGGIKQMVRYLKDGEIIEVGKPRTLSWEEIVEMFNRGEMDEETFRSLEANHLQRIAEVERER